MSSDAAVLNQRVRVSLDMKNTPFLRADATHIRCNGHKCGATIAAQSNDALERAMYQPIWIERHWKTYLCDACQRLAARRSLLAAPHSYCVSCLCFASAEPCLAAPLTCGDTRVAATLCATCIDRHRAQLAELVTVAELHTAARSQGAIL